MRARGWQSTDGSTTALLLLEDGRIEIWTNLGQWNELHTEDDPESTCLALVERWGLEEMHPDRLNELLGVPMTEDEAAGYGDSQERT